MVMDMSQSIGNLTDRELLIRLYERVDLFIAESKEYRMEQMERIEALESRPCPAKMCMAHDARIGKLEDHEKIIIGVIVVVIPIMIWAFDKVFK
jgi:hypothetical protein